MASGSTRTTEKDLRASNAKPEEYRDGSIGVATPMEIPCYIRCFQIHEKTSADGGSMKSEAVKANIVQEDFYSFGVKVITRLEGYGPGSVLKIYVQDSDGTECVAEYTKG